jgi:hypothetical protein
MKLTAEQARKKMHGQLLEAVRKPDVTQQVCKHQCRKSRHHAHMIPVADLDDAHSLTIQEAMKQDKSEHSYLVAK